MSLQRLVLVSMEHFDEHPVDIVFPFEFELNKAKSVAANHNESVYIGEAKRASAGFN